jgi:tRNA pseudouridine38-40 synthase
MDREIAKFVDHQITQSPNHQMRVFKITVAYDGAGFAGWQRQGAQRTVQGELEGVLARIEGKAVSVMGAGRTDAGVHAAGQVASVRMTNAITAAALLRALNAVLPVDVRVRSVDEMPLAFNARMHARQKTYHYWIWNARVVPPLMRGVVWHVPQPLDLDAMIGAAPLFEGTHDFAALQARGARVKTTTRTILVSRLGTASWSDGPWSFPDTPGALLRYEASGTGFLRHMVRTMAGTLVEIGRGRRQAADVPAMLATRRRAAAGRTAPPHGLVLWRVDYAKIM